MIRKLINIWRPEVYHNKSDKATFFEGWFYKLVDSSRKNVMAIIPGVFLHKKENESHAFIQVLDGFSHRAYYHRYPLSQFQSSSKNFSIRIGTNIFNSDSLEVDIQNEPKLNGRLTFSGLQKWPVRWNSPGAMGWYAFVPFMECYHGIISLDHRITGELQLNERLLNFDEGRGYLEKDWGRSFPQAYIWMQGNHFDQPGINLTLSIARIPWLRGYFRGFIIGFLFQGGLFRFTTYNGAKLKKVKVESGEVKVEVVHHRHGLRITARGGQQGVLHGPYENAMVGRVVESLDATISVSLFEIKDHREELLYSGKSEIAGLEMNGELAQIVDP